MVLVLKKEVVKTASIVEKEEGAKYRQLLVRTLHQCSLKFPDVAASIIPVVSLPSVCVVRPSLPSMEVVGVCLLSVWGSSS